jgi:hypothetical protein
LILLDDAASLTIERETLDPLMVVRIHQGQLYLPIFFSGSCFSFHLLCHC